MNQVRLNKVELIKILDIINSEDCPKVSNFTVRNSEPTGIGVGVDLIIQENDTKKIIYDVTDYDCW